MTDRDGVKMRQKPTSGQRKSKEKARKSREPFDWRIGSPEFVPAVVLLLENHKRSKLVLGSLLDVFNHLPDTVNASPRFQNL
jgi:hypothetical protein